MFTVLEELKGGSNGLSHEEKSELRGLRKSYNKLVQKEKELNGAEDEVGKESDEDEEDFAEEGEDIKKTKKKGGR